MNESSMRNVSYTRGRNVICQTFNFQRLTIPGRYRCSRDPSQTLNWRLRSSSFPQCECVRRSMNLVIW